METINPVIGIVGPFTGPRSAYGRMLKKVAESEVARHDGSSDRLIFCDDKASYDCSVHVALSLVKRNVKYVVGHFNSDSARAASPIYHKHHVQLFLPASTANVIPYVDTKWINRLCGTNHDQGEIIRSYLVKHKFTTVFCLIEHTNYALEIAEGLGLDDILVYSDVNQVIRDREIMLVQRAESKGCLILLGTHPWCVGQLKRFNQNRCFLEVIACDDCDIDEFWNVANKQGISVNVLRPVQPYSVLTRLAIRHLLTMSRCKSTVDNGNLQPHTWVIQNFQSAETDL